MRDFYGFPFDRGFESRPGTIGDVSTYIALVFATGPSPYMKFSSNTDLVGAAWPVWGAILGAIVISMLIGAFTERVIIRPIKQTLWLRSEQRWACICSWVHLCVNNGVGGRCSSVPLSHKRLMIAGT